MKNGIEIVLKNGDVHSYKPQDYSEYLIIRNLFVITCQTGAWLAGYNLDEIRYFRLTRYLTDLDSNVLKDTYDNLGPYINLCQSREGST